MIDWTQIIIHGFEAISVILTAYFTRRSRAHAVAAQASADVAVEASMRAPQISLLEQQALGHEPDNRGSSAPGALK